MRAPATAGSQYSSRPLREFTLPYAHHRTLANPSTKMTRLFRRSEYASTLYIPADRWRLVNASKCNSSWSDGV